jgi:hypothetical protein
VWPCPPAHPDRPDAGWLQAAVDQLVATHTRPGDPVLIVAPPPPLAETGVPFDEPRVGPADLLDATGRAAVRRGRRVQVQPAPAASAPRPSGSGPGPVAWDDGPEADACPLVVTVVEPIRAGWVAAVPWPRLVAAGGVLAVVTHSESLYGLLIDPTATLTAATTRHGLALVDRFVLLEVPLDDLDPRPTPLPRGTVARRVHSDLLLFAPVLSAGPQERR